MFFSTPIDLDKWNSAKWSGAVYLFSNDSCPILGFLFKNYQAGKSIFEEWKKNTIGSFCDDFLKIDFIVPPFPADSWIYSDPDHNHGKGYFIHVGPNVEKSIDRSALSGIRPEKLLLTMVSRYQWMDERSESVNRDTFIRLSKKYSEYLVVPIGVKNDSKQIDGNNVIYDFEYAIRMKNVYSKAGDSLRDDDLSKAVLRKPEQ